MVYTPIGFRRDYKQNVVKKKIVGKKGFIIKKDVYENITFLLNAKIYIIFKNKDIEKIHLKKDKIEKMGEEISKKLLESSKEISDKLSKSTYQKFEEEHKEELKDYKEYPKFPQGPKVKEITKEQWKRESPYIQYPEGGLFKSYPKWYVIYNLEFESFSVILNFEIRKDFPVVTEDSIEELAKLIANDLNYHAYEAIEETEKVRDYILKSDKKVIEQLFRPPFEIWETISMINTIKMFKEQEKLHNSYHY
jgi:hypothetical protein